MPYEIPYPEVSSLKLSQQGALDQATQDAPAKAFSEQQLQAAQSEKAKADAWRARNVIGKGEQVMAKGGPVVNVGYKHSNNPMYAKYGATMDSSLLAKNRNR